MEEVPSPIEKKCQYARNFSIKNTFSFFAPYVNCGSLGKDSG